MLRRAVAPPRCAKCSSCCGVPLDSDRMDRSNIAPKPAKFMAWIARIQKYGCLSSLRRPQACKPAPAKINEHRGRIVRTTGDACWFYSSVPWTPCVVPWKSNAQ